MRFQVPQFIEVEDQIIGPFTLKQFIYLAGGAGLCIVIYLFVPTLLLSIPLMVPVVALSAALAFYKINNRPFISIVESFFRYHITNKLYIWKHRSPEAGQTKLAKPGLPITSQANIPKLSQSKLKDLAWTLDVQDRKTGSE